MSTDVETVFLVPRLNSVSVAGGSCCPVPAEALIVPELEAVPGVVEAAACWESATVRVRHSAAVPVGQLAGILAELDYPAESWNTESAEGVTKR